jgi:hypothetical protein
MAEQQRFPLSWPVGWKRTSPYERQRAPFSRGGGSRFNASTQQSEALPKRALTVADAIQRLSGELARLGASDEILSTNVPVRLDGLPRSGQSEPTDPGAAVYFKLKHKPRCLACDRWARVADNIAAIAQHIDALRRIERYGVGTMEQAFAGYAQLQASPSDWWIVLEVSPDATTAQIDDAYRQLARKAHPDAGGSHDQMARLNAARDVAKREGK